MFIQNDIRRVSHRNNPRLPVNFITPDTIHHVCSEYYHQSFPISKQFSNSVPWGTFWLNVHTQVSSSFNILISMRDTKRFLSFANNFSFDRRSLTQYWRRGYFFKEFNLLRSRSGWRFRAYKSVKTAPNRYILGDSSVKMFS